MLHKMVAHLLGRMLQPYLNIDPDDFSLKLWTGVLEMNDIEVRAEVFNSLMEHSSFSAYKFKKGRVGHLRAVIPWRNLMWGDIEVDVDNIVLVLESGDNDDMETSKQTNGNGNTTGYVPPTSDSNTSTSSSKKGSNENGNDSSKSRLYEAKIGILDLLELELLGGSHESNASDETSVPSTTGGLTSAFVSALLGRITFNLCKLQITIIDKYNPAIINNNPFQADIKLEMLCCRWRVDKGSKKRIEVEWRGLQLLLIPHTKCVIKVAASNQGFLSPRTALSTCSNDEFYDVDEFYDGDDDNKYYINDPGVGLGLPPLPTSSAIVNSNSGNVSVIPVFMKEAPSDIISPLSGHATVYLNGNNGLDSYNVYSIALDISFTELSLSISTRQCACLLYLLNKFNNNSSSVEKSDDRGRELRRWMISRKIIIEVFKPSKNMMKRKSFYYRSLWRYSIQCVLLFIRNFDHGCTAMPWEYIKRRSLLRKEYCYLYMKTKHLPWKTSIVPIDLSTKLHSGLSSAESLRLYELVDGLSLEDLILFRLYAITDIQKEAEKNGYDSHSAWNSPISSNSKSSSWLSSWWYGNYFKQNTANPATDSSLHKSDRCFAIDPDRLSDILSVIGYSYTTDHLITLSTLGFDLNLKLPTKTEANASVNKYSLKSRQNSSTNNEVTSVSDMSSVGSNKYKRSSEPINSSPKSSFRLSISIAAIHIHFYDRVFENEKDYMAMLLFKEKMENMLLSKLLLNERRAGKKADNGRRKSRSRSRLRRTEFDNNSSILNNNNSSNNNSRCSDNTYIELVVDEIKWLEINVDDIQINTQVVSQRVNADLHIKHVRVIEELRGLRSLDEENKFFDSIAVSENYACSDLSKLMLPEYQLAVLSLPPSLHVPIVSSLAIAQLRDSIMLYVDAINTNNDSNYHDSRNNTGPSSYSTDTAYNSYDYIHKDRPMLSISYDNFSEPSTTRNDDVNNIKFRFNEIQLVIPSNYFINRILSVGMYLSDLASTVDAEPIRFENASRNINAKESPSHLNSNNNYNLVNGISSQPRVKSDDSSSINPSLSISISFVALRVVLDIITPQRNTHTCVVHCFHLNSNVLLPGTYSNMISSVSDLSFSHSGASPFESISSTQASLLTRPSQRIDLLVRCAGIEAGFTSWTEAIVLSDGEQWHGHVSSIRTYGDYSRGLSEVQVEIALTNRDGYSLITGAISDTSLFFSIEELNSLINRIESLTLLDMSFDEDRVDIGKSVISDDTTVVVICFSSATLTIATPNLLDDSNRLEDMVLIDVSSPVALLIDPRNTSVWIRMISSNILQRIDRVVRWPIESIYHGQAFKDINYFGLSPAFVRAIGPHSRRPEGTTSDFIKKNLANSDEVDRLRSRCAFLEEQLQIQQSKLHKLEDVADFYNSDDNTHGNARSSWPTLVLYGLIGLGMLGSVGALFYWRSRK